MLYNAACAQARLGHKDEAASTLLLSVKAGFRDFEHMRLDPDLESIRQHPTYLAIVEAAERVAANVGKSAVERWREDYGSKNYRYETDDQRRINYATALDQDAHKRMREMLEREADQLTKTLFEKPPSYYILIAIPTPDDSDKFFHGNDSIGGMYEHTFRRLVSRDIGNSLRHEFVHALHFGHMARLDQPHPLWIVLRQAFCRQVGVLGVGLSEISVRFHARIHDRLERVSHASTKTMTWVQTGRSSSWPMTATSSQKIAPGRAFSSSGKTSSR